MPRESRVTDGSFADCVDAGVVVIGLDGGPASHGDGRAAAARELTPHFDGPSSGTADAIYKNLTLVKDLDPARVLVQIGEERTDLDYRRLLATHTERRFGTTVGCVEVPVDVAQGSAAVLGIGPDGRVVRLSHRPQRPQGLPNDPARALIALDVYVFDLEPLIDCLWVDAADPGSTHDLNRDVLPLLVSAGTVAAHVFRGPSTLSRLAPR